jgi:hypothetical protein
MLLERGGCNILKQTSRSFLFLFDRYQSQFIDEKAIMALQALINIHFEDVLCYGICVKDIYAVKLIKSSDF